MITTINLDDLESMTFNGFDVEHLIIDNVAVWNKNVTPVSYTKLSISNFTLDSSGYLSDCSYTGDAVNVELPSSYSIETTTTTSSFASLGDMQSYVSNLSATAFPCEIYWKDTSTGNEKSYITTINSAEDLNGDDSAAVQLRSDIENGLMYHDNTVWLDEIATRTYIDGNDYPVVGIRTDTFKYVYNTNTKDFERIKIPASIATIEDGFMSTFNYTNAYYFTERSKIKEIIVDPLNVNYSSENGVLYDKNKTKLVFVPGVDKTRTSFVIPNTVISVADYAFMSCYALSSITIPTSLTTWTYNTFLNTYHLQHVHYAGTLTQWLSLSGVRTPFYAKELRLYGSNEKLNYLYFNGDTNPTVNVVIPNEITSIPSHAFMFCNTIQSITLHSGVATFAGYCFLDCRAINKVVIPSMSYWLGINFTNHVGNPLSCGADLYIGQEKVENISISGISNVSNYAFCGCTSIKSVVIEEGVQKIGIGAFAYSSITSVSIPSTLKTICQKSENSIANATEMTEFLGCFDLESISVAAGNTYLDSRNNCNCLIATSSNKLLCASKNSTIPSDVTVAVKGSLAGLKNVYIPSTLTDLSIENSSALKNWNALRLYIGSMGLVDGIPVFIYKNKCESIVVDQNHSTYDSRDNCNALVETSSNTIIHGCKNTTIPATITTLEEYSFACIYGMSSITIPATITNIKKNILYYCVDLQNVYLYSTSSETKITFSGNSWFYGCQQECVVHYPTTVSSTSTAYGIEWKVCGSFNSARNITSRLYVNTVKDL